MLCVLVPELQRSTWQRAAVQQSPEMHDHVRYCTQGTTV